MKTEEGVIWDKKILNFWLGVRIGYIDAQIRSNEVVENVQSNNFLGLNKYFVQLRAQARIGYFFIVCIMV